MLLCLMWIWRQKDITNSDDNDRGPMLIVLHEMVVIFEKNVSENTCLKKITGAELECKSGLLHW